MNADRLIDSAAAKALLYSPTDAAARANYEIGLLRGLLREKCSELAVFTDGAGRPRGSLATVYAGDAPVLVEFSFTRGEPAVYDVNRRDCGPGCPPAVTIEQALVNGEWIDPLDAFDKRIVERWEEQLLEQQLEDA